MTRFIDPFSFNNFVDANILDEVAEGQDAAVNEIVRLMEEREITVLLPYSVQNELDNSSTPPHVRRVATKFLFSVEVELTDEEQQRYRDLVAAAKGSAAEKNIAPDLFHVCEAAKYGGYFITRDKRLLRRKDIIASVLQIEVVTPTEFLGRVVDAREWDSASREQHAARMRRSSVALILDTGQYPVHEQALPGKCLLKFSVFSLSLRFGWQDCGLNRHQFNSKADLRGFDD